MTVRISERLCELARIGRRVRRIERQIAGLALKRERSVPVCDPSRVQTDDAHIQPRLEGMLPDRGRWNEREAVGELPAVLGRSVGRIRKLSQRNPRPLFVPATHQGRKGTPAGANLGKPIEIAARELEPKLVETRWPIREVMQDRQVVFSTG